MMSVGILGAGQLARMLALAAHPMGIKTICLAGESTPTIEGISSIFICDENNVAELEAFGRQVDVITYETENISLSVAKTLEKYCRVSPSSRVLQVTQDRLQEKMLFQQLDIAAPRFATVDSLTELQKAIIHVGLPAVLKTCRFGYDGKGQFVLREQQDIDKAWDALNVSTPLILEEFIPFDREVSLIAVRNRSGKINFYPLVENVHRHGILRISTAPFIHEALQNIAQDYMQRILTFLDYCGVLVIEFFQHSNALIANEMAPRVHNSGHWTIEGAATSQFENHLRAICDLPLGSTEAHGYHAMFNFITKEPSLEDILKIPNTHFHTYEKEARLNRKLGHVTLSTYDKKNYEEQFEKLKELFFIE